MDSDTNDSNRNTEVCYTDNGAPIFKRKTVRCTFSFCTPEYQQINMARELSQFYQGARGVSFNGSRPSRPLRERLKNNPVHATRHVMLSGWCNSWLHFVGSFLNRVQIYLN